MPSPHNQSANVDLFDAYLRRADFDRDGRISGNEAVAFFQGSGHPNRFLRRTLIIDRLLKEEEDVKATKREHNTVVDISCLLDMIRVVNLYGCV
ncbi:hypothetical protein ACFXTO_035558 [Malus domestica]